MFDTYMSVLWIEGLMVVAVVMGLSSFLQLTGDHPVSGCIAGIASLLSLALAITLMIEWP